MVLHRGPLALEHARVLRLVSGWCRLAEEAVEALALGNHVRAGVNGVSQLALGDSLRAVVDESRRSSAPRLRIGLSGLSTCLPLRVGVDGCLHGGAFRCKGDPQSATLQKLCVPTSVPCLAWPEASDHPLVQGGYRWGTTVSTVSTL